MWSRTDKKAEKETEDKPTDEAVRFLINLDVCCDNEHASISGFKAIDLRREFGLPIRDYTFLRSHFNLGRSWSEFEVDEQFARRHFGDIMTNGFATVPVSLLRKGELVEDAKNNANLAINPAITLDRAKELYLAASNIRSDQRERERAAAEEAKAYRSLVGNSITYASAMPLKSASGAPV